MEYHSKCSINNCSFLSDFSPVLIHLFLSHFNSQFFLKFQVEDGLEVVVVYYDTHFIDERYTRG